MEFIQEMMGEPSLAFEGRTAEELKRRAEREAIGHMAEAAQPWFESFRSRLQAIYLKDLVRADKERAYEVAVQMRVLDSMGSFLVSDIKKTVWDDEAVLGGLNV